MKKKDYFIVGAALGVAAAAAIFYFLTKNEDTEKPPKKAPQVPIQNPGEQSDFLTSASESEIG
jgi:hypothetical protein